MDILFDPLFVCTFSSPSLADSFFKSHGATETLRCNAKPVEMAVLEVSGDEGTD